MCRNAVPIKLWVLVDEIGRRCVAKLPIHPSLLELVVQRIGLAEIVWVTKLTDKIGSSHKQPLFIFLVFGFEMRRKARVLDCPTNPVGIDIFALAHTLGHE